MSKIEGQWPPVVIGAPHGTYDEYTAEIVKRLGFRTGLAAVIARGFSPTEAGGWRINVNRPSEKTYLAPQFEVNSSRSRETYRAFREAVIDAAGGDLRLYFDIHQYGGGSVQIATMGVSAAKAHGILSIARKSVHIELPLHSALRSEKSRDVYTRIVSELINQAIHERSN
jgi:hypothetical protein